VRLQAVREGKMQLQAKDWNAWIAPKGEEAEDRPRCSRAMPPAVRMRRYAT
jgi:hypothetical protein